MKKRAMILLAALVMFISAFPACPVTAADVSDFPVYFTNFNTAGVDNEPDYYPYFEVEGSDLLVQAVTTYHWNYGQGSVPGAISIYDWDDNLIGTWNAAGRGGDNRRRAHLRADPLSRGILWIYGRMGWKHPDGEPYRRAGRAGTQMGADGHTDQPCGRDHLSGDLHLFV